MSSTWTDHALDVAKVAVGAAIGYYATERATRNSRAKYYRKSFEKWMESQEGQKWVGGVAHAIMMAHYHQQQLNPPPKNKN